MRVCDSEELLDPYHYRTLRVRMLSAGFAFLDKLLDVNKLPYKVSFVVPGILSRQTCIFYIPRARTNILCQRLYYSKFPLRIKCIAAAVAIA